MLRRVLCALLASVTMLGPLRGQSEAAKLRAAKGHAAGAKGKKSGRTAPKEVPLAPLTERERAQQVLNRFTFGPRPGEVERVLAMGVDRWLEQQMDPSSIKDDANEKRLREFPTLGMQADQALLRFPNRGAVEQVAKGLKPAPTDPLLAALYEVQVAKYNDELGKNKVDGSGKKADDPSESEMAAKKDERAAAARIAGDLFALPKEQRMAALIRLPVAERIAFTSYLQGPQRNVLLGEFTPVEREVFTAMAGNVNSARHIGQELAQAKMVRAIGSERQLQEVMADFWFNHFNVFVGKEADEWYTTSYDRDAIRAHALGKFRDLLIATAESPAMMVYLDNWQSIGPNSKANAPGRPGGKQGNKGLNENYGREVMELHTVGVNGGYTQADVTALASIFTGWGVDRPFQAGGFVFEPRRHEPGAKEWMGHTIGGAGQDGMQEGVQALTILAASPETARFLSWKMAQRFVADDPPAALVERMAKTYLATDGDIKAVLRTLASSPEFNSRKYFRNKVKTPVEFLASAYRTTETDPSNPGALVNTAKQMGMDLFHALPPTGYAITADHWMNSGALVERLNFAYQLTNNKFANQKFDSAHVLALGLMAEPPAAQPVRYSGEEAGGMAAALRVLETTLIGAGASVQTNQLIRKQVDSQEGLSATDQLNLLAALVIGSPEFQVH